MTKFYQINVQSGDHMICQLIEKMAIIDHHGNYQSINWLNYNRFTAVIEYVLYIEWWNCNNANYLAFAVTLFFDAVY